MSTKYAEDVNEDVPVVVDVLVDVDVIGCFPLVAAAGLFVSAVCVHHAANYGMGE